VTKKWLCLYSVVCRNVSAKYVGNAGINLVTVCNIAVMLQCDSQCGGGEHGTNSAVLMVVMNMVLTVL
jgi:hypothetical protein